MPELGIVIPTLERTELLTRALARLEHQAGAAGRFEVIVARDAAARDPLAIVAAVGARSYPVRLVEAITPGAAAARNAGWRATPAPLVLFLDDDVLATTGLVAAHLAAHARNPSPTVGVLGYVRWVRDPPPTAFMRWLVDAGIQFDFRWLQAGDDAGWWRLYTANASVKRELLERVHGFDEQRFPFGYEDLDLGARMAKHGLRLRYEPAAVAEHFHPQTLDDWLERVERIAAAERRFCESHPDARPYFRELFTEALAAPVARGRGARLAHLVPRATPWLGARVWASFDSWHRQQLAGPFLAAWEAAGDQGASASAAGDSAGP